MRSEVDKYDLNETDLQKDDVLSVVTGYPNNRRQVVRYFIPCSELTRDPATHSF
jgi:hypothetical protein